MILNALDEVLYWNDISILKQFIQVNMAKYYPNDHEGFYLEKQLFMKQHIPDKETFIERLTAYMCYGSATWVSSRNGLSDDVDKASLMKAIRISSQIENGRSKALTASEWQRRNPDFWNLYSGYVLRQKRNCILELTIGAGGGTNAVMQKMSEGDCYIGVDIDFVCAKNADALAKHYGINGLGMATSLWHLPFDDAMFSSVCCNAGLEECREIPTILTEAVRVLTPDGALVIRCLCREKVLWYSIFEQYGFCVEEAKNWLRQVRLFSDVEQVKNILFDMGLTLVEQIDDGVLGHIIVFQKSV